MMERGEQAVGEAGARGALVGGGVLQRTNGFMRARQENGDGVLEEEEKKGCVWSWTGEFAFQFHASGTCDFGES